MSPLIKPANKPYQRHIQRFTDAQQRLDGDRTACLYLLPMPCRETERDHVFLAEFAPVAEFAYALAQSTEEGGVIHHAAVLAAHDQKHHERISWDKKS